MQTDILSALRSFIVSRPSFEPRNYHTAASYRADVRACTQARNDALALLASIERTALYDTSILSDLSARAGHGGRLTWDGKTWDYTAGQYYPMEYRHAARRLLADVIHAYGLRVYGTTWSATQRNARLTFGRGIAARAFR